MSITGILLSTRLLALFRAFIIAPTECSTLVGVYILPCVRSNNSRARLYDFVSDRLFVKHLHRSYKANMKQLPYRRYQIFEGLL
jgi:hypothetical protein